MGQEVFAARNSMQDLAELLQAARWTVLRDCTSAELLNLVPRLERACEAARVAALTNLRWSGLKVRPGGAADRTFGFAELYSALRRVRAETKRREAARHRPPAPAVGHQGTAAGSVRAPGRSSAPQPRGSS